MLANANSNFCETGTVCFAQMLVDTPISKIQVNILSVESQKGAITIQRCPLRTRRALSPKTLYDSPLAVLSETSLNIGSALLALN